jgi:hypothetical protein
MVIEVPLTRGFVALIDDDDGDLVLAHKWRVNIQRNNNYGATGARPHIYLHRLLLPDSERVDHIDRDGLNNQRANLRAATHAQNLANSRPMHGRRFKGTREYKPGRWLARVGGDGRHLGVFGSEEEAARAYDQAAYERWGDFAWLNFPEEVCK